MVKMKKHPKSVTGTNLLHAKNHNMRAVLDAVRRNEGLSRADITRITNLSAQTISNLVAELEDSGLLLAGEPVRQKRGQPARPYRLNPDGGYAIGFQLSGTQFDAVLVNLLGEQRHRLSRQFNHPDPQHAIELLVDATNQIITDAGLDPARNIGIGIAMPGPVGIAGPTGIAPGWEDFDIATAMTEMAGCPVFVENDADAAAVSEKLYGNAKALDNFVYIFIGYGLGAGLFMDGHVIHGANGAAGEIGHLPVEPGGRECTCGRRGCLECYVSLLALYAEFDTTERESLMNDTSLGRLAELSPSDAPVARWIKRAAPHLATTLQVLGSMLDPQAVIMGGLLPAPIRDALLLEISKLEHTGNRTPLGKALPIHAGAGNTLSAAMGAAALPIYQEMVPDFQNMLKIRSPKS